MTRPFRGYHYFWHCDLVVRPIGVFFKLLTLLTTFEQRVLEFRYFTLIFFVTRPFRGYFRGYFDTVTLTLEYGPFFENFNLANKLWTASARVSIFHMNIASGQTFPGVPLFQTLWPWPWSSTYRYFYKTLTLLITFEQRVLELWYLTWVLLVATPFSVYKLFWPCDLGGWPIFEIFLPC